jgi:hypothetical protein
MLEVPRCGGCPRGQRDSGEERARDLDLPHTPHAAVQAGIERERRVVGDAGSFQR